MQPETAAPKPPSTAKLFVVLLVILVLLAAAVVAGLRPRQRQRAALAGETRELAVPGVTVVAPIPGKSAGGLLLPAEISPWIEAPIYARASGYLKRWLVDIGTRVEAGQLLAEIETPELAQELARARYQVTEAETALALAKSTAERYALLLKTASVNEQETSEKQADFVFKTATLNAARANVRRLEELQAFALVTAPFPGVITMRDVSVGDLITAGGNKQLFRLAQTDKLRVFVRVPQTQAAAIKPGLPAELLLAERPGKPFAAQVSRTAGAITPDSRTLLTELEVDNAAGEILAGSYGQVKFTAAKGQGPAPLTLPGNTLLFRAEGPQVGVVLPDGKVELHGVKIGRDFGKTIEILGGITPTSQVIINPSDSLANGATVRAVVMPPPEATPTGKAK